MRILFATGIYPPDIGGPAYYTEVMARAFKKKGHEVFVLAYGEVGDRKEENVFRVSRKLPSGIRHLAYAWKVWREGRSADLIYAQDSFSAGLPAAFANIFLRKFLVLKVVGDYAWEQAQGKYGITDGLDIFQNKKYFWPVEFLRFVSRRVARAADFVITPSKYLAGIAGLWGVEKLKIKVIYNAVPKLDLQGGTPLKDRPRNILSVGRIVPWKGFEEVIFVMREVREVLPDAQLIIVGEGPERAKLENMVLEHGLESAVHFPGRIPHDQLPELYGTSAAFVLNTAYEGFSHQLIEVMAAGLPVATTLAGGNTELVRDGENAIVFPLNDLGAIKAALVRLLTDFEFAERITKQGLEDAKEFSEDKMVEKTVDFFDDIINGKRALIVSLDKTVLDTDSPTSRRMLAYAEKLSALTVLVLGKGTDFPLKKIGTKFFAVRFGGNNKAVAFLNTLLKICRLVKKVKPDAVSSQDPFFAGLIAFLASKFSGSKLIVELHGDFWPEDRKLHPDFIKNFIAGLVLKRAGVIRVVSPKVSEGLIKKFPGLKSKSIEIFPIVSGEINPWPFPNKPGPGNTDKITILFVGRLTKEKGLDWFLPVFARVAKQMPLYLRIVGEGEEGEALKKLAKDLEADSKINFIGAKLAPLLDNEYREADFLVLPSRQESWGRVVVESLKSRTPVIITDKVGAKSELKNGESALIVPFGNDEAMANALQKMAGDSKLRKRLAENGFDAVRDLSPERTAEQYTGLLKKVMKICFIAGARPNFMKVAALIEACKKYSDIEYTLVHTGQHYDESMSKVFFDELGLPRPDYNLGVGGKSAKEQKKEIREKLSDIFQKQKFDAVVVVGDVTSTLAGAEAAKEAGIPLAHVEAGLRSRNMEMPEEGNRIETDKISDYLFASEPDGLKNLEGEKVNGKKYLVGNVMIDTLRHFEQLADKSDILKKLGFDAKNFVLVTLHRAENLGKNLGMALKALESGSKDLPVIFPVHPRTKNEIIATWGEEGWKNICPEHKQRFNLIEPLGYVDFLKLMKNAKLVLTDSGGIQEETTIFDVPCLTLRNETERPITVERGTNEIVGLDEIKIKQAIERIMNGEWKHAQKIEDWDGYAAERIIEILHKEVLK